MSDELKAQLDEQLERFKSEVASIDVADALYELQVRFLGKKGSVTKLRSAMGKLAPEQRKAFGQAFNTTKQAIEAAIEDRKTAIEDAQRQADLARREDLTLVGAPDVGTLHPITRTRRALIRVFQELGFDIVDGPHIEHERYNFDDLNFPADHPARDMQDTFFVQGRPEGPQVPLVLRTHTSPQQVRTMLARKPPIRVIALGTVFRFDEDSTHSPMFHQIEGLCIDQGANMADLKATLYRFVRAFFGHALEVRFRPSYFPFVEPGAEFDVQCPFCLGKGCNTCKRTGWIELGGSGMTHPAVLEAGGIDPEAYTGWAFGFGIDRMAMMLHAIDRLGLMFEGDVRFLEQFPC